MPAQDRSEGASDAGFRRRVTAAGSAVLELEETARDISRVAAEVSECLQQGGKLMIVGNGGSAAQAQHLAAEFVGRFSDERRPLAALALSADGAAVTAIGNDYGFDSVFSRQIEALGRPGDVVLAISTSGASPNVLRAVEAATANGMMAVALTGNAENELAQRAEITIATPAPATALIQEAHMIVGHIVCEQVEHLLFGFD